MEKLWRRDGALTDDEFVVEQFIRANEDGTLVGWEIYANGDKSSEVELTSSRTIPLGFIPVEPREAV